jgi:hypothetical protein
MRALAICLTLLSVGPLGACRSRPAAEPEGRVTRVVPLDAPWLEGKASVFRSLAEPSFGLTLRVRGRNFGSLEQALGTNNPCFSVAFVQRCDNGVSAPCRPATGVDTRGRVKTLDLPIWCPSVGTAFAWHGEFTDYRHLLGSPGTQFQPLMRCSGNAVGAVFLFPSPLLFERDVVPLPGIPLEGLRISEWVRL